MFCCHCQSLNSCPYVKKLLWHEMNELPLSQRNKTNKVLNYTILELSHCRANATSHRRRDSFPLRFSSAPSNRKRVPLLQHCAPLPTRRHVDKLTCHSASSQLRRCSKVTLFPRLTVVIYSILLFIGLPVPPFPYSSVLSFPRFPAPSVPFTLNHCFHTPSCHRIPKPACFCDYSLLSHQ